MEAIATEVVTNERARDAKGRRLYSAQRRAEMLRDYESSGLTQWAYAKREGINYTTLVTWIQRVRKAPGQVKGIKFEEVVLPSRASEVGRMASLCVVLPDGIRVSGGSAREVAELVRLLKG